MMAKTPTWQRKAGQSESGGLNEKGRASLRAAGHDIKRPQPEGGARKRSFCARMEGMKRENTSAETARDPDSRINKSLRKWNCADGGAVDPYDAVQQAAKGGPIWDRPRPKKLGKSEPLSPKQKASAKAAAKAAGRPYPNLIDNMRAARADGGQIEGDVQFAPEDPYAKVQEAARLPMMAQNEYSMRMPEAPKKEYKPFDVLPLREDEAGIHFDPNAGVLGGMKRAGEYFYDTMSGRKEMDPTSPEAVEAASNIAGMTTLGAGAFDRPAGAISMGANLGQDAQEAYQRVLNAQGLYSHAAEAAANLPQAKGSYEQMMAMLQRAGVKPEELHWSGAQQFAGQPVTREQLVQHFEQGVPKIEETVLGTIPKDKMQVLRQEYASAEYGDTFENLPSENKRRIDDLIRERRSGTSYHKYTIPGGENYREVLMHMPAKLPEGHEVVKTDNGWGLRYPNGSVLGGWATPEAAASSMRRQGPNYESSHWDQPNVLAHLRLSDRTGSEGEKILHMEELQSDWGQAGRKTGFETPESRKKLEEIKLENNRLEDYYNQLKKQHNSIQPKSEGYGLPPIAPDSYTPELDMQLRNEMADIQNKIKENKSIISAPKLPSAPYVASPEGKHTSSWVDLGLKRALREAAEGGYNKLVWTPGAEQAARYDLSKQVGRVTYNPNTKAFNAYDKDFKPIISNNVEPNKLADLIGKDAADKLLSAEPNNIGIHQLQGDDLSVGGEGMKSFYDKIVPTQLQKILKKLDPDAKVQLGATFRSPIGEQIGVHEIQITPRMREAILKGLPAFADGGKVVNKSDPYDNIQEAAKIHPRARRASH